MRKHFSTTSNCNLELPEEGTTMQFVNYKDMLTRSFIVYPDFEASLVETHRKDGNTHRHVPNSAGLHLVCTSDESRNEYHEFNRTDCVVQLIKNLQELSDMCTAEIQINQQMILTREDKKHFNKSKTCYICSAAYTEDNHPVRDRDHRTGRCRGSAHKICNISHYSNRYLPVCFHNLKVYDSHHILRSAVNLVDKTQHTCHPTVNGEVHDLFRSETSNC